ncbi:MAG: YebC/PmpR family DNA-binding transcriptional regulator [Patescibacteria group bacterium]|nr:YebC/PmpR family DNA-binding transcriptional regulator [Patescibacteria group bacterium]
MSGHNKFSKIKHIKAKNDAQKSKLYGKLVRLITVEAKKAGGNVSSPGLAAAIDKARKENMPNDTIERAISKASDASADMETVTYEAYGPGGAAILMSALTDNRNRTLQELKAILSRHDIALASPGSASWAFEKGADGTMAPVSTIPLDDADIEKLTALVEAIEEQDDIQDVLTNAE